MNTLEHILCVHYYYPPIRSGGVLRNYFVSLEFSKSFHSCHVLTTSNRKNLPAEELELPSNIYSYPISTFDFRTLLSSSGQVHISESKKSFLGTQLLLRIQKSFPFNLIFAEGGLVYIVAAYRKGKKLIKENNIQTIYSSAFPYADHVIAHSLKKKFPHLKWIADFRDLQVEPIYKNVVFPNFQRWCEKKILKRADLVTSVSQGLIQKLKEFGRPTHTMLRGIQLRRKRDGYSKFTISYTGSLYKHFRDPQIVFESISELIKENRIQKEDIQFIYAGRDGNQMEDYMNPFSLNDIFENLGFVSRDESLAIQEMSHLNLVLTSSSTEIQGVITGKIFEYIESNRPVLVIINGNRDDEIEAFINNIKAGAVFYSSGTKNKESLKTYLLNAYLEWKSTGHVVSHLDILKVQRDMSWSQQVSQMMNKIG